MYQLNNFKDKSPFHKQILDW